MLKKKIDYTDFLGNARSKNLYFHISLGDATRMMMEEALFDMDDVKPGEEPDASKVRDGLGSRIKGVMERGRGSEILELFDWLVRNAYGEIEDDGETFAQGPAIYQHWTQTASYDKFFTDLITDTDLMTEFVNGIFPEELRQNKEKLDPEFASHRKAMESR